MKLRIPLLIGMMVAMVAIMYSCSNKVHANQHSILLTWNPVPPISSVVFTYTMKEGPTGGPYTTLKAGITAPNYTDPNVAPGNRCYVVVASATGWTDSNPSKEACANVPADTVPQVSGLAATIQ